MYHASARPPAVRHGSSGPMNQAVNSWTREYLHSEPSCWRGVPRYTAAELYVHETGAQQNRKLRLQLFQFGLDGGLVAVQACLTQYISEACTNQVASTIASHHDQRAQPRKDEELNGKQATDVYASLFDIVWVVEGEFFNILGNGCNAAPQWLQALVEVSHRAACACATATRTRFPAS